MGRRATRARRATERRIRSTRLAEPEKALLRAQAFYEGSPFHKRNPGDFGLTPPAAPRPDATLCDETRVLELATARRLFAEAIDGGLVSEAGTGEFPKELWVVGADGQVFEAMYGGSRAGAYHGYPIRRSDPWFDVVTRAWTAREEP